MFLALAFGVDENVIKIHYHKIVKLLYQNLVDITLKRVRYIGQSKKHDRVLEMAIVGLESRFLFVAFFDSHPMVGIDQVKLVKC